MSDELKPCEECETDECPGPGDFMQDYVTRREFLKVGTGSLLGLLLTQWLHQSWAQNAAPAPAKKAKSVILLWMNGGPTQLDTWDPKPGTRNGGPVKAVRTRASDVQISEYMPQMAEHTDKIAIVRSVVSQEGDHGRAQYLMHTGYRPSEAVAYPNFGSIVVKEFAEQDLELPQFVRVRGPNVSAGFLGTAYNPLVVTDPRNPIQNLSYPQGVDRDRFELRMKFLDHFEDKLLKSTQAGVVKQHGMTYDKAVKLMHSPKLKVFDVTQEPMSVRQAYGVNPFGEGALMARRLVENGVKFVEVSQDGWDTHGNNFAQVRNLCNTLDPAFATLLKDLKERNLLDSTLVIWMGEFGRTPNINRNDGRDHFTQGWSVAVAGGGIKGGQVIGATNEDGTKVVDRPVSPADLFTSYAHALGLSPAKQNMTPEGRPIRITDKGTPIKELFV